MKDKQCIMIPKIDPGATYTLRKTYNAYITLHFHTVSLLISLIAHENSFFVLLVFS